MSTYENKIINYHMVDVCLMIEDETLVRDELLLTSADYPSNYVDLAHPEDYKLTLNPVYELTFHIKSHHNRLLLRASWKVNEGFVPMTFVIDTGAPMYFYLSKRAQQAIASRIQVDELQSRFVEIDGKKALIQDAPQNHDNSNIIGLLMICRLQLQIFGNSYMFGTGSSLVF